MKRPCECIEHKPQQDRQPSFPKSQGQNNPFVHRFVWYSQWIWCWYLPLVYNEHICLERDIWLLPRSTFLRFKKGLCRCFILRCYHHRSWYSRMSRHGRYHCTLYIWAWWIFRGCSWELNADLLENAKWTVLRWHSAAMGWLYIPPWLFLTNHIVDGLRPEPSINPAHDDHYSWPSHQVV